MASIDSDKATKNLLKKGFQKSNGDHRRLEFFHDGKFVLHTKVSHGGKHDLDDYLIKQMAAQCKLEKVKFLDLVRCPLSKEGYLKILRDQKLLS